METPSPDVGTQVGDSINQLRDRLVGRTQEIRDAVDSFVEERPLASVGIAFGVGYLLSGALFSRTTFRVAHLGARVAFGGLLRQLVLGTGAALLATLAQSSGAAGDRNRNRSQQH
jgi:hypothetical protein